jgi:hypothetical protein
MPRTNVSNECRQADIAIYDELLNVIRVTTEAQRKIAAYQWTRDRHEDFREFCAEKNIRPIALIAASLMQVEHPICTRENGDFIFEHNLRKFYARILSAIVCNEVVHIPMCTTSEQVSVVHMDLPKTMMLDELYTNPQVCS